MNPNRFLAFFILIFFLPYKLSETTTAPVAERRLEKLNLSNAIKRRNYLSLNKDYSLVRFLAKFAWISFTSETLTRKAICRN